MKCLFLACLLLRGVDSPELTAGDACGTKKANYQITAFKNSIEHNHLSHSMAGAKIHKAVT
jgi:hypothetical protein